MKKLIIITMAICLVMTGVAFAGVVGSKHDMSTGGGAGGTFLGMLGSGYDQVCVFCHTPHGGDQAEAPLWNHNTTGASYTVYTSATLNATSGPTGSGVSKACLSCHDGTTAVDAYGGPDVTGTSSKKMDSDDTAYLGTDLRDDHPVGFTYNPGSGATEDSELNSLAAAKTAGALFFGGSVNQVECGSCHDVHNPGTGATSPFLVMGNTNSALCLACHAK